jgi:hypothetical protein
MTTYKFREFGMLEFTPEVTVGGELDLNVLTLVGDSDDDTDDDQAAPDLRLAHGDIVQDSVNIVAGTSTVVIRVYDSASHTMEVWSTEETDQWERLPSGTPTRSQYEVTIPATEDDVGAKTIGLLILARNSAGAVVARRSQVVIIRHRPTA